MNGAVTFEYEWMADGSLRIRFLDRNETILGQQVIAAEGLPAFQLLISLATAIAVNADPQTILNVFHQAGVNADLQDITALMECVRVRAATTPEGGVGLNTIDDDDMWI